MDGRSRFITESNIGKFVDLLHIELDSDKRRNVRQLLIEEEDKFGRVAEKIVIVERYISTGLDLITKQSALVDKMTENGEDTHLAEMLLFNLLETQSCLEQARQKFLKKLEW